VYCWRDEHPLSAKLLATIGMTYVGDEEVTMLDGAVETKQVWSWQNSL
jgi:hypothetical protein